jgi:hypothetical protein
MHWAQDKNPHSKIVANIQNVLAKAAANNNIQNVFTDKIKTEFHQENP